MKNNQKGFSVLLAVVIVAAIALAGGGAYVYTTRIAAPDNAPMPEGESEIVSAVADETSSAAGADIVPASESGENLVWQTYRNKEHGFEIGYPGDRSVSSYENKLARFATAEDIGFEAKCKEGEAELVRKKMAFGPTGCLFGIFISIIDRAALEELYSMAPYKNKSIRDGWYDVFQLNRDYLAPDLAVAIQIGTSDSFIVLESFNAQDGLLERMLPTFKFNGLQAENSAGIGGKSAEGDVGNDIKTRELDSKEYELNYVVKNLFGGQPIIKEILDCTVPDLSKKCPETGFIGKVNCDKITHAPADCAYEGVAVKSANPTCIYNEFESVAMGTALGGYNGLVISDGRCFLLHWEATYRNCQISGTNCAADESQRKFDNEKMLSTFKFIL